MVWFSEIQKVFNPFGISFITTHGCILFILKLKCFSPLLNDFFFFISASVITWGRDVYIWKICHQRLPHFIPFPYKYVHLWGFNHWHLMHRHISAHILKSQPCWISLTQDSEATHRLTIFLLQKRYNCISGSWSYSTWLNAAQPFPVSLLGQNQ